METTGFIPGYTNLKTLPPDIRKRLPELTKTLENEMMKTWKSVKDGFAFDEIDAFADDLLLLGNDYQAIPLIK